MIEIDGIIFWPSANRHTPLRFEHSHTPAPQRAHSTRRREHTAHVAESTQHTTQRAHSTPHREHTAHHAESTPSTHRAESTHTPPREHRPPRIHMLPGLPQPPIHAGLAPMHTHAIANSCCSYVKPHPFRSMEHTTASEAPDEHTLATALPGSSDPHSSEMREPCRPCGRLAMTDGMDRCSGAPQSAAARAGDTRGRTERPSSKCARAQWRR